MPGERVEDAYAESPFREDAEACWCLHPGTDGNAMGSPSSLPRTPGTVAQGPSTASPER